MEELSSLGVNLLLIKLDAIRFLLNIIFSVVCGILGGMIGFAIAYLIQLRKRNKGK